MELDGHLGTERMQHLRGFVSSLTEAELRYLRLFVNSTGPEIDIFARLPVELQLQIAKSFDGADIWPYLNVSRAWRNALTGPEVLRDLSHDWFPGLVEHVAATGLDPREAFLRAARDYHFRYYGKFRSVLYRPLWLKRQDTYFSLDTAMHPPGSPGPSTALPGGVFTNTEDSADVSQLLYAHGRIAWKMARLYNSNVQDDYAAIIVDDLRSRLRRVCRIPGEAQLGGRVKLQALGDKLVVASINESSSHLCAWDLHSHRYDTVRVPGKGVKAATRGPFVAFLINSGDMFLWKFYGMLLQIDVSQLRTRVEDFCRPFGQIVDALWTRDVIVHPSLDNVSFLAQHAVMPSQGAALVLVHEFEGTRYVQTYTYRHPMTHTIDYGHNAERVVRISSYGEFKIFGFSEHLAQRINKARSLMGCFRGRADSTLAQVSICFNVYTRAFSVYCHHTHTGGGTGNQYTRDWVPLEAMTHIWNGQVTMPYAYEEEFCLLFGSSDCNRPGHSAAGALSVSLHYGTPQPSPAFGGGGAHLSPTRRCSKKLSAALESWTDSSSGSGPGANGAKRGLDKAGQRLRELAPKVYWTHVLDPVSGGLEQEVMASSNLDRRDKPGPRMPPAALFGDDDFLLYAYKSGYVVWSFRDDLARGEDTAREEAKGGRLLIKQQQPRLRRMQMA